ASRYAARLAPGAWSSALTKINFKSDEDIAVVSVKLGSSQATGLLSNRRASSLCSVCVASPPKNICALSTRPPVTRPELAIEPGPRKRPVALGRPLADAQDGRGFLDRESAEEAQLHQRRGLGIDFCQAREGRIQVDQVVGLDCVVQDGLQIQGATNTAAAAFEALAVASAVNQDSPHGLGRGREKMAPAVPGFRWLVAGRWWLVADKTKVRLVNEGGWLQSLARLFAGDLLRRQLAQFVVDERQELLGRGWVALFDGRHDTPQVAHRVNHTPRP